MIKQTHIKKILALMVASWTSALCLAAFAEGVPKIQFEQTTYDFGRTSQVENVSGVFKFKNVGDGVLRLEPPAPSCGCTTAELKTNTLLPGASGELPFTMNLGHTPAVLEKQILVKSNDPLTPQVSLTIRVDYTPLYDLNPMTLSPSIAFGANETEQFTTLSRTDGKPVRIARLDASKPWITATVVPSVKADDAGIRIRVKIQREGSPRRFNEFVHVYTTESTNTPVSSIYIYGQAMGEVSLSPEALYWSITDGAKIDAANVESQLTRRVAIRSAAGQSIQLTNQQSSLKGIKLELVAKEPGKSYELVARLDEVPTNTVSGMVSFETSVAAQPRMEIPVIVNVFKP